MPGLERVEQRRLVMDAAARRRDEDGTLLHPGESARVHHLEGAGVARAVQRHEIRLLQQSVQRHRFCAAPADLLLRQIRIEGENLHVERTRQRGDDAADIADPDQAHDLAAHLAAHDVLAREAPLAPQQPVAFADPPRDVEHHADGVLGDRLGVAAGLVHDQDTGPRAGGDIDRVVAGPCGRDAQQLGAALEQLGRGEPLLRQLVPGRGDLIGMRFSKIGPGVALGTLQIAGPELDVGLAREPLLHRRVVPEVEADHELAAAR